MRLTLSCSRLASVVRGDFNKSVRAPPLRVVPSVFDSVCEAEHGAARG